MTKNNTKKPKTKHKPAHKKVFDVVPPGKSIAAPNSRSVIMGHKPQVKDDQFVPGSSTGSASSSGQGSAIPDSSAASQGPGLASDPSAKRPLMDSRKKIDLKPQNVAGVSSAENNPEPTATPAPASTSVADSVPAVSRAKTPPTDSSENSLIASEHLADLAVEQVVDTEAINSAGTTGQLGNRSITASGISEAEGTSMPARVDAHPAGAIAADGFSGALPMDSHVSGTGNTDTNTSVQPKTVDDLLAETGAPDLEPHNQKAIVSTHRHHTSFLQVVLILLLVLVVGLAALNFLLDAGIVETELDIPFTNLIKG